MTSAYDKMETPGSFLPGALWFQISKLILRDHQGTMSRWTRMRYTQTSWSLNTRVPVG